MMKVLVTGATGFIGSYVIEWLLSRGIEVIATSTSKVKATKVAWFNKVKYVEFNLNSFDEQINYFDFFHQPDKMLHLAWEGLPNYKDEFHVKVNVPRHEALLENMLANGLKDLTVTGTCLEYGMKEGGLKEDMECSPVVPYAIAKDILRQFLENRAKTRGVLFRWVRLFYMYGKGQNPQSLFSQLELAIRNDAPVFNMSGGEQERDYLPVETMAEYIGKIMLQDQILGAINCCSGKPVKVKELVENYLKDKKIALPLNLGYYPYSDYEPMKFWGDTNKLNRAIK